MTRPWMKLWKEKLLSSERVRQLKPWAFGVYMRLMICSDDDGALKSGRLVWGTPEIREACNARHSGKRLEKAIDHFLEVGLLQIRGSDGAYVLANYTHLQKATAGTRRARTKETPRGPRSLGA